MGRSELLTEDDAPRFWTIVSEAVLRAPMRDPVGWRNQLEHLLDMSARKNVTVQVLPLSVGLHALMNTDTVFLRSAGSRTVAWVETGYAGELVEETRDVDRLQLHYDLVRDLALSPDESRKFIRRLLEEAPCKPST
ncbi:DUF5753 domain-containing protein [Streptomyces sp. NBC_00078]|uniref:DUF5753 domain-containing protein n=1 Tax=unclassified Streptomyces TaxID=2593676 RepID=UPI002B1D5CB7|nr:DUF5753 domain-containing protein [Streptomyces sp. NBC_00078]